MNIDTLLPPFISIAAGTFLMGTPERELSALAKAYGGTRESYREESPQFSCRLEAFAIAQTPVSNASYAAYVAATGTRAPTYWQNKQPPALLLDHPVVDVSLEDANAFCRWLTKWTKDEGRKTKVFQSRWLPFLRPSFSVFRLPTEAEWERAARGTDGQTFPWGNEWDDARANTREGGPFTTTPIGAYPLGASPVGCHDMCGNVWEWTTSLDAPYPYNARDGRESPRAQGRRILRGGCYANPHGYARCACRFRLPPDARNEFLGFRLVRA